jgi:hypothetical protein
MRFHRPALSGPLHAALHLVVVIAGWCLFGAFWWIVLRQPPHPLTNIAWLLVGTLVVLPGVTLYWVLHNRGIYLRKGPRRLVQAVETRYAKDWAGRPVHADFAQLKLARSITILSTADDKFFQAAQDSSPTRSEAA